MPTISSAGIGSGLDVNSIVTQLMAVERKPLTALDAKASVLDSKISAFGTIKSQLATLSDAVDKLSLPATWNAKAATSSNSAAVGVAVNAGGTATATSFSIEVTQLARAQSVASAAIPPGAPVGSGTLSIELGSWRGTDGSPTFSPGSAGPVSVGVDGGDSVADIASKINKAAAGVTATVLKDASGERLLLRSAATGEAAGFRVQAQDDGGVTAGAGLSVLAFDDPAAGGGMAANPIQYAQDAKAKINGIGVTSATNALPDTVPGVSLTLSQLTTAPAEIVVTNDTAAMRSAIDGFVKAYNATNQMLNSATKFDAGTKTAALLQGDATTVGLQNALRQQITSMAGGGVLRRLSDVGISIARNGAGDLAVDSTRLDAALKTPDAVRQFFSAPAAADGTTAGFATRFAAFAHAALAGDGALSGKTTSLQAQKTTIGRDQDRLNDRLTLTEQRLRKQYTALDTTVGSMTALNNYISQQIAQWNKSSS